MPASSSRLLRLLAAAAVAGVALTGCSSGGRMGSGTGDSAAGPTKSTNAVAIKDFKFVPAVIRVKVGTVVTWTNSDAVEHSATGDDKSFDSRLLAKGKSYAYTFTEAGTFPYHCTPHQYMTGTVIVT